MESNNGGFDDDFSFQQGDFSGSMLVVLLETGVVALPQKGNTNMTTLKVSFSTRTLISIQIEDSFTMGLNLIPNDPDTVFHEQSLFNWLLLPNMTDIDWWQMANSTNKMSGWCFVGRIHEPSPSRIARGIPWPSFFAFVAPLCASFYLLFVRHPRKSTWNLLNWLGNIFYKFYAIFWGSSRLPSWFFLHLLDLRAESKRTRDTVHALKETDNYSLPHEGPRFVGTSGKDGSELVGGNSNVLYIHPDS